MNEVVKRYDVIKIYRDNLRNMNLGIKPQVRLSKFAQKTLQCVTTMSIEGHSLRRGPKIYLNAFEL